MTDAGAVDAGPDLGQDAGVRFECPEPDNGRFHRRDELIACGVCMEDHAVSVDRVGVHTLTTRITALDSGVLIVRESPGLRVTLVAPDDGRVMADVRGYEARHPDGPASGSPAFGFVVPVPDSDLFWIVQVSSPRGDPFGRSDLALYSLGPDGAVPLAGGIYDAHLSREAAAFANGDLLVQGHDEIGENHLVVVRAMGDRTLAFERNDALLLRADGLGESRLTTAWTLPSGDVALQRTFPIDRVRDGELLTVGPSLGVLNGPTQLGTGPSPDYESGDWPSPIDNMHAAQQFFDGSAVVLLAGSLVDSGASRGGHYWARFIADDGRPTGPAPGVLVNPTHYSLESETEWIQWGSLKATTAGAVVKWPRADFTNYLQAVRSDGTLALNPPRHDIDIGDRVVLVPTAFDGSGNGYSTEQPLLVEGVAEDFGPIWERPTDVGTCSSIEVGGFGRGGALGDGLYYYWEAEQVTDRGAMVRIPKLTKINPDGSFAWSFGE